MFFISLSGCNVSNTDKAPPLDLPALKEKIKLDIPAQSAAWEIFGTPEYKGGVPGPTDLQTLVAEIELPRSNSNSKLDLPMAGEIFVAPESAREWLSPDFKELMKRTRNSKEDMGRKHGCFKYETTITASGRAVSGFVCVASNKALLYLTLDQR